MLLTPPSVLPEYGDGDYSPGDGNGLGMGDGGSRSYAERPWGGKGDINYGTFMRHATELFEMECSVELSKVYRCY
jgi:hypothetical protein